MPIATDGTVRDVLTVKSGNASAKSGKHLESLRRDGFVVIKNLISADQVETLRKACEHITTLARNNGWPHVRTVPKQYPPWPANQAGLNIWGIQHLLHPDMPNRKTFAELYFGDAVLDVVKELVGLPTSKAIPTRTANEQFSSPAKTDHNVSSRDDFLVMELFNLLVSPGSSTDFELCWHRDDIKPDLTPKEEQSQLSEKSPQHGPQLHAQYNLALYDDSSLIVVPGSHKRVRTVVERDAAPYEASLPGQISVHLGPGDAVFYDSNILHRGVYSGIDERCSVGRMTLHGSVGLAGHGNERARQVLQHAVGQWVDLEKETSFGLEGRLGTRAVAMRKKLVAMGRGDGVGYSLDG